MCTCMFVVFLFNWLKNLEKGNVKKYILGPIIEVKHDGSTPYDLNNVCHSNIEYNIIFWIKSLKVVLQAILIQI